MADRVIEWVVGGPRHDTSEQSRTPLYFWTDQILLCERHSRGMCLQPFTTMDRAAGFGTRGCPFCPGGELVGTYAQYPSQRKLRVALNGLAAKKEVAR